MSLESRRGGGHSGGRVLGLDIGGANIKAATCDGQSAAIFFPMWQRPETLARSLVELARGFPPCDYWAVTMTGEMADVFYDRSVGVAHIAQQTITAAAEIGCHDVRFYSVPGELITIDNLSVRSDQVASANWHAMATWVSRANDSPALLIDVGSTTTDIIPIASGRVVTASQSDFDRLAAGELVYVGGGRTPVCSLVCELPYRGLRVPVMRELFATTDDCALVLAWTDEVADDHLTSDGGPRTIPAAVNRLARMIGLDHRHVSLEEARAMAIVVMEAAAARITGAIASQPLPHRNRWILAGHAADYFLCRDTQTSGERSNLPQIERLADRLGAALSRVGPAFACARLAAGAHKLESRGDAL